MEFHDKHTTTFHGVHRECRTFPPFTDNAFGFSDYIELYVELYFALSTIRSDPTIKIVPNAYALFSGFSGLVSTLTSGLGSALISGLASGLV